MCVFTHKHIHTPRNDRPQTKRQESPPPPPRAPRRFWREEAVADQRFHFFTWYQIWSQLKWGLSHITLPSTKRKPVSVPGDEKLPPTPLSPRREAANALARFRPGCCPERERHGSDEGQGRTAARWPRSSRARTEELRRLLTREQPSAVRRKPPPAGLGPGPGTAAGTLPPETQPRRPAPAHQPINPPTPPWRRPARPCLIAATKRGAPGPGRKAGGGAAPPTRHPRHSPAHRRPVPSPRMRTAPAEQARALWEREGGGGCASARRSPAPLFALLPPPLYRDKRLLPPLPPPPPPPPVSGRRSVPHPAWLCHFLLTLALSLSPSPRTRMVTGGGGDSRDCQWAAPPGPLVLRAAAAAAGKMAAAASCSSAAAAPAGPGPGPVSAGPGSCEWLLLRDGCLRCDADGLCSLCYHPALNAILAVTARGAIKVIDGTSGATLQASALNGERRAPAACRAPAAAARVAGGGRRGGAGRGSPPPPGAAAGHDRGAAEPRGRRAGGSPENRCRGGRGVSAWGEAGLGSGPWCRGVPLRSSSPLLVFQAWTVPALRGRDTRVGSTEAFFFCKAYWRGYWKIKWGLKAVMYRAAVFYFSFSGVLVGDITLNLPKIRSSVSCTIDIVLIDIWFCSNLFVEP